MLQLVLRRLVLLIPTLILVTFGTFSLLALVPGDVASYLAGGESATPARIAEVKEQLGLDDPYLVQYGRWLGDAVRLDFGESLIGGQDVTEQIKQRLPVTAAISIGAMLVGLLIAVPVGLWSGARQGGRVDRTLLFLTSGGMAIPNFVVALLLVNYFAVKFGWFDAVGFTRFSDNPAEWLRSLTLPAVSLGLATGARLARQLRSGVVDTLNEPYIRTAWAKGSSPVRVIGKHVLKNAAMPSVTIAGLVMGSMIGGTVIIENIFSAPGVGNYLVTAIVARDMPVIQGAMVLFVLTFVLVNLIVDIIYGWLNPKIEVA
jgi:peptide/nickel transport system permease protein